MAFILNIETATPLCSVAIASDGKDIVRRETLEEKSHASSLTVFISEMLQDKKIRIADLDAIAVGMGPGSYTGLRIGISTAKGLCYGSGIPLIAISTLAVMLQQVHETSMSLIREKVKDNNILFCPMIDARRMEVFTCLYNMEGREVEPVAARIIDKDTFQHQLSENIIAFFGTGMEKCQQVLSHPNALFIAGIYPHASAMAPLAEQKFSKGSFENIAYFEPFYLKDFIATIPKKGLHV